MSTFLERDSVDGWCRIASGAVGRALVALDRTVHAQAVGKFERWLGDSAEAANLRSANSRDQTHVFKARRAIEHGRWADALVAANAAASIEECEPSESTQLIAAATFGSGAFGDALELLRPAILLEAIFGTLKTPAEPNRIVVGLSAKEDALRYAAWLCTRTPSLDNQEWIDALDQLQGALDPDVAAALQAARAQPDRPTSAKAKPARRSKPTRRPKISK
ncbi:hypothetical protein BH11MYX2_BH11MYX2_19470 [soil metagenome]